MSYFCGVTTSPDSTIAAPRIAAGVVARNQALCAEHLRLTLLLREFPAARPGQFVQLSPTGSASGDAGAPFLPRAFSIGGLRRSGDACELDVVYRVVGVATTWMQGLRTGHEVNVMGPLGRPFRIPAEKSDAVLVIGGVGLPPLLWLAEALRAAGKRTVAALGARTWALVPQACVDEFAALGVPVILSTDDGSAGFRGNVVAALEQRWASHPPDAANTVAYTCGPERMMRAVAERCTGRGIECQVCLERPMACGVGTCQSCIVTVKSERHSGGQRYALCCSEGPIFPADQVIWTET